MWSRPAATSRSSSVQGEFVGELALLVPDSVRSARVRAVTDVRCLAIGAGDFRQLLDDEPRIALAMLPVVAERLWRARQP